MATLNLSTKTTLDYAIPEWWDVKVRDDAARKAFFGPRFEGPEGSRKPIIRRDDFTKQPGDTIHIQVLSSLGGDGVTGESTLEGNEEQLSLAQFDLSVDWLRHAVAFTKKATKEANFNAIMAAGRLLSDWFARETDASMFTELLDTATPDTLYSNDATSTATLGTNDTFGTTEIDRIKVALQRKGAIPLSVKTKGGIELPMYGIVISEIDEYNLKADSVWNEAQRDAGIRGENNNLFLGALGVWNGCIIYTHHGISGYQGTPLRPECSIYGSHTDSVNIITVGANTNRNYTKFFPSTGTLSIVGSDGTREFVTYTGKTNNTFTGCTRGDTYGSTSTSGAAYTGNELVTSYNHRSRQLGFGAEIAARGWGKYFTPIKQMHDYNFEHGVGVECVYGQKAVENSDGNQPNYLVNESYAANPNTSI